MIFWIAFIDKNSQHRPFLLFDKNRSISRMVDIFFLVRKPRKSGGIGREKSHVKLLRVLRTNNEICADQFGMFIFRSRLSIHELFPIDTFIIPINREPQSKMSRWQMDHVAKCVEDLKKNGVSFDYWNENRTTGISSNFLWKYFPRCIVRFINYHECKIFIEIPAACIEETFEPRFFAPNLLCR